jgi:hypothetical protein
MHRMIEQILDATRLRLTAGIVVQLGEAADLGTVCIGMQPTASKRSHCSSSTGRV